LESANSARIYIMKHQFTSVIEKRGRWYVAYIEEIPGVNTQGRTLAEARRNLKEALTLVIEANRELAARQRSRDALREPITVSV
jgi:predicted RNase H-like HicB family nuclease